MEIHHFLCNTGNVIVMTDYICTNLQERHYLSYYPIHIILKRIQWDDKHIDQDYIYEPYCIHIYPHLILRIHVCTMFYQTFYDVNMSFHGCQMKSLPVHLKQSFTTINALIGFIITDRRTWQCEKMG